MKRENKCILWALCTLGVLLEEFYCFKVYPEEVIIITIGLALCLIFSYQTLSNFMALHAEWKEDEKNRQNEQLEQFKQVLSSEQPEDKADKLTDVERFEKAIYMAIQKQSNLVENLISDLDQHLAADFENVTEQIKESSERNSKVSVKYGRENTKSLMVFQQKAYDNVMLGMEELSKEYNSATERMIDKLQEMITVLQTAQISTGASVPLEPQHTPVQEFVEEETADTTPVEEEPLHTEDLIEEPEETPVSVETETIAEDIAPTEETPVAEPEPIPEPETVSEDPNHIMTPEEIAALVSGAGDATTEPTPEPVPEPAPVSEDPNHIMTPEEIAALVSGAGDTTTEPAPETVPEPAPVSDDPNHIMTPEEIAALISGSN